MNRIKPESPSKYIRYESDAAPATVGHVNYIIDEFNSDFGNNGFPIKSAMIQHHTPFAVNVSATVGVEDFIKGYFTSTSAAAVSLQLETAANIAAKLGATAGTVFDFFVDNTAGANTVTVVVGSGIAVVTPAITGGATLTVSTSNDVGQFRLVFQSAEAAKLFRIA